MSEQMDWQKYEEGTGAREMQVDYVYDARGGRVCDHDGNPLWSRRDGIRVQAAHADNGSMDARPFPATRLDLEQFVQERVHQALCELDTRIENAVRRAMYGDLPDVGDLPLMMPHARYPVTLHVTGERQGEPLALLPDEEERAWDETFSKSQVRAGLRQLADEARREDEAGECEEGGFGIEDDERVEAEIVTVPDTAPHALTISFVHDGVKYHGTLYEVKE